MAKNWYINGETMVYVKGHSASGIPSLTELGLCTGPITISEQWVHFDMNINAWGDRVPMDTQQMLGTASVHMNLVYLDMAVMKECIRLSAGGAATYGGLARAGTPLGGGVGRFVPGNCYIGLNIVSGRGLENWRFFYTHLTGSPLIIPLGAEKSIVECVFRAVPYAVDPWNGGLGSTGAALWDNGLDS